VTHPLWARSEESETLHPASPPPPKDVEVTLRLGSPRLLFLLLLLAGLALRLIIAYVLYPGQGLGNDLRLYSSWAQTLANYGPGGFYAHAGFVDYTPGYLYVLWLIGAVGNFLAPFYGGSSADAIQALLKLPAIVADMGIAWLLYRSVSRWYNPRAGLVAAAFYLFIPVAWYDSALWGQMDSVGALLLLAAMLLLIDGWSEPATALAVIAAVTKPQYAIGLLVVLGVVVGRHILRPVFETVPEPTGFLASLNRRMGGWFTEQQGLRRLVGCLVTAVVVFLILILPFDLQSRANSSVAGTPILGQVSGYASLVANSAAYYNVLTANAFNAWALVGPTPLFQALSGNYVWTYDSLSYGLSASTIGTVLFSLVAVAVVAALAWRNDRKAIVLGMTVLAVAFFALPTRVHERYLFPAFGIGAILAATSVGWRWWYLVLGLANAVNLHAVLSLPYEGYGTPAMRALPLAAETRAPITVILVALVVSGAFVVLSAAFLWEVLRPAIADMRAAWGLWYEGTSQPRAGALSPAGGPGAVGGLWAGVSRRGQSIGRAELGIALLLVVLTFGSRVYQLATPRGMYFDEVWHAATATEFLQGWRYNIPHSITEWTHPPLAKYVMAESIAFAGDNRVTSTNAVDSPVTDVAFEPTYWDPSTATGKAGDRIIIATGTGLLVAEHGDLASAARVPISGARAVTVDTSAHRTFVGTSDGTVWQISSTAFDSLARSGAPPQPVQIATVGAEVTSLRAVSFSRVIVQAGDRVLLVDVASKSVTASLTLNAINAVETFNVDGTWLVLVGTPDGVIQLNPTTLAPVAQFSMVGGAKGLDLVYGSIQQKAWRNLLGQPTVYVATGAARLELLTVGSNGGLTDRGGFAMPGSITSVRWNRATNLVHVLGKTRDDVPTVYVVEPNDNAVFADAQLSFQPVAWVVDAQPNDPGSDRERVLAFSGPGSYATIDAGSNAFAWRLPGVIAGALLAGLLYLLAMLLFHRRSVGLIFAALISIDGLMFGQSRIGMNDVYMLLFIVAAFVVLVYMLQSQARGRRAFFEGLLLPPLMGLLFGLALASKWPAVYAMGGAGLIILLRSNVGRWLALAGMVALTAVFGYQAFADNPTDLTFTLLMLGLTVLLGVGIVRAGPASGDGPRWLNPVSFGGLPFTWVIACLVLIPAGVYVASYIPWATTAGPANVPAWITTTANNGLPQLYAGYPSGHTGWSFWDLQQFMYKYHNEFRWPHGASSPWWAWPFDLKPIWAYLENMAGSSQATILDAGNPFLFWLGVPAAGFGMWQAWRRRDAALGVVCVALLALWLPWARIDRVTFNYHFYAALPFFFLLLAYFLAELWDGPSIRTWLLARVAMVAVVLGPAILWIGTGPLCGVAGVDQADPTSTVCTAGFGAWPAWALPWLFVWGVVCIVVWRLVKPRHLVVGYLVGAAVAFLGLYPALTAWVLPSGSPNAYQGLLPTWDVSFQFASNKLAVAHTPFLDVGTLIMLVVTVVLVGAAMYAALYLAGGRIPTVRVRLGGGPERDD
jgi:Gpi18-like mannosyltransferase